MIKNPKHRVVILVLDIGVVLMSLISYWLDPRAYVVLIALGVGLSGLSYIVDNHRISAALLVMAGVCSGLGIINVLRWLT